MLEATFFPLNSNPEESFLEPTAGSFLTSLIKYDTSRSEKMDGRPDLGLFLTEPVFRNFSTIFWIVEVGIES